MFAPFKDLRLIRAARNEIPTAMHPNVTPIIARQVLSLLKRGVSLEIMADSLFSEDERFTAGTFRLLELIIDIYRPSLKNEMEAAAEKRFSITKDQWSRIEAHANGED